MSAGSRIIIAVIALVCAAGFFLTALEPNGLADSYTFYGFAVFCLVIAISSLSPKSHPITLRMIGTIIFCGYLTHAGGSLTHGHLGRALVGLLVCGLPAGYLAIQGKYLRWGVLKR
ncbi:hypothetical protein [Acaryochloris thomasi]|uniref:hypothetical protein n=1 Tax=Acaryochloris thomasi TaxID=2929456 RepID=UPI0011B6A141|nr:hypothetical protein [Acaryochloris thomasi]